jgi:hypothetical protein
VGYAEPRGDFALRNVLRDGGEVVPLFLGELFREESRESFEDRGKHGSGGLGTPARARGIV